MRVGFFVCSLRIAALAAAACLPACVGSSGSGGPASVAAAAAPRAAPILARDAQRAVAQSALVNFEATASVNAFLNGGNLFTFETSRSPKSIPLSLPADGSCQNGATLVQQNIGVTQTQDYTLYRDPQCQIRRYEQYIAISTLDVAHRSDTIVLTDYDSAGNAREISRDLLSYVQRAFSDQIITFQGAKSHAADSTPFATLWNMCSLQGQSLTCQIVQTAALANGNSLGAVATLTGNASRGANRVASGAYNIASQSYLAPSNGFSIVEHANPAPWTLRGGVLLGSAVQPGGTIATPPNTANPSFLPITDALNDATVTPNMQGGGMQGTLSQTSTGKQLAIFSIDASGNGAIQYSDRSTATIMSWSIAL